MFCSSLTGSAVEHHAFELAFTRSCPCQWYNQLCLFLKRFEKPRQAVGPKRSNRFRRDRRPHHPAQETLCTAFVPFLPCLERRSGPPTHRSQRRQSPRRPHRQQSVRRARKRTEKYVIVDLRTFPPKAFKPVDKNRPILT